MSRRRRKTGGRAEPASRRDDDLKSPTHANSAGDDREAKQRASRPHGKHPILRFVVLFGVCMGIIYALTATSYFDKKGWVPYLNLNARLSGSILEFLGRDVTVSGRSISSAGASIQVERGCDAIHPSALFVSAILAAPASLRRKIFGMLVGTTLLMMINLIRIITLFYVRLHRPDLFELMHAEVWQALFIFLAILLWIVWALWATRTRTVQPDASA
jgi:exosortase H (IPTLxxWG-CTERM-specific)